MNCDRRNSNIFLYTKIGADLKYINSELIQDSHKDFIDDFTCPICNGILMNPVQCLHCHTMFCKQCIASWIERNQSCPIKCPKFEEQAVSRTTRNIIEKIKLNCPNRTQGCDKSIRYDDFVKHVTEDCEYLTYKCNGCGINSNKKIMQMHVVLCDSFTEPCKFCNQQMKRKDLSQHVHTCLEREIKCEFCNQTYLQKVITDHRENCKYKEVMCIICKNILKEKEYKEHIQECYRSIMNLVNKLSDDNCDLKERYELLEKKYKKTEQDKQLYESKSRKADDESVVCQKLLFEVKALQVENEKLKMYAIQKDQSIALLEKDKNLLQDRIAKLERDLSVSKSNENEYKEAYNCWKNKSESLERELNKYSGTKK